MDTAGTSSRLDTSPEQWTDFIANKTIQDATSLLCVEEVFVDYTRFLDSVLYGAPGDFVEDRAMRMLQSERFFKRPGNKFALAIRVRSKEHFVCAFRGSLQIVDKFVFFLNYFVLRRKVFARVHSQALFR